MTKKNLLKDLFQHQIRALEILSVVTALTTFIFAIIGYFIFEALEMLQVFIPFSILILINQFLTRWHKNIPLTYNIITLLCLGAIIVTTWFTGGFKGGFLFLLIAISTSTFIYSKKQGFFWFSVTLLVSIGFLVLHILGYEFKQIVADKSLVYFQFSVFFMLQIFTAVTSYSFSRSNYRAYKTKRIIDEKNKIIEKKNEQIMDSIRYAKRIQDSLLASDDFLNQVFKDHFVLYKPKDVVGGDFYWAHKTLGNKLMWAVGDCTGHGIPGAFMSMVGVSLLNEIVIEKGVNEADLILHNLGEGIIRSLNQEEAKSGMEVGLCIIDLQKNVMQYSGAKNPLYLIRNEKLIIYEGSKKSVGFNFRDANNYEFTKYDIRIESGDVLYMFSDGYYDQLGGPDKKRFMSTNMQKLLVENAGKPMEEQRKILNDTIKSWHKDYEQVDDILVMGVKL